MTEWGNNEREETTKAKTNFRSMFSSCPYNDSLAIGFEHIGAQKEYSHLRKIENNLIYNGRYYLFFLQKRVKQLL